MGRGEFAIPQAPGYVLETTAVFQRLFALCEHFVRAGGLLKSEKYKRKGRTSPETTQGVLAFEVLDYICRDGQDGGREGRNHGIEELQSESSSSTDEKRASTMAWRWTAEELQRESQEMCRRGKWA